MYVTQQFDGNRRYLSDVILIHVCLELEVFFNDLMSEGVQNVIYIELNFVG